MNINQQKATCSPDQFFKIVDIMEEYDAKLTQLNQVYNDAMIELSFIKFQNSDTSVTSKGFKPTPALLSIDQSFHIQTRIQTKPTNPSIQQSTTQIKQPKTQSANKQESNQNLSETISLRFAHRIEHHQQQFDQQQQIQREVSKFFEKTKEGTINPEQAQQFMVSRFNVLNNTNLVRNSARKFTILLETCCTLLKQREKVLQKLQQIERQRQQNKQRQ